MERSIDVRTRARERIPMAGLAILSALLLVAANFRLGIRVSIGDEHLRGVYSFSELQLAVRRTELLAGEILGEHVVLRPFYSVRPALTPGDYTRDMRLLEETLMGQVPGITRLCSVRIDGEFVGWVSEPSELGELIADMFASASVSGAVSARMPHEVTAEYLWARSDTHCDAMAISAILMEMTDIEVYAPAPGELTLPEGVSVSDDGLITRAN